MFGKLWKAFFTQSETIPANMKRKSEFGISELKDYFNKVGYQYITVTVSSFQSNSSIVKFETNFDFLSGNRSLSS